MDEFYAIKVFNKSTGERGFVIIKDDKLMMSDSFTGLCSQFSSKRDAYSFIKEKKLSKSNIEILILSNEDLIKEGVGRKAEKTENFYAVMDLNGDFLFFDTVTKNYYFDKRDTGYCIWNDRIAIDEFINSSDLGREVIIKQIN